MGYYSLRCNVGVITSQGAMQGILLFKLQCIRILVYMVQCRAYYFTRCNVGDNAPQGVV